jgi:hypothetical protein
MVRSQCPDAARNQTPFQTCRSCYNLFFRFHIDGISTSHGLSHCRHQRVRLQLGVPGTGR